MQTGMNEIIKSVSFPLSNGWEVKNVEVDNINRKIILHLAYIPDRVLIGNLSYPVCGFLSEIIWSHQNLFHFKTFIRCNVPGFKNIEGKITGVEIPWEEANDSLSRVMEKIPAFQKSSYPVN